MVLDPLATTADLDARTITWTDQVLADTYLNVASTAIRDAAGCPISSVTSTVDLWAEDCSTDLRLPGGPVTAVTSVVLDGRTLTQGTDYVLRQGALYRPSGWLSRRTLPGPATVTWTHGLTPVPADIVDLVCRMTTTALGLAALSDDGQGLAVGQQVQNERLGDYSITFFQDPGDTEMVLSEQLRDRLRARFGVGGARMVTSR